MGGEWIETTLADTSTEVSYGYTESASAERIGPRFLRITDIQNGVVNWNSVPFCPITKSDHEKYRLYEGDIVIARTGNSTGENFLFRGNEDSVFASYLIRFRIDQSIANPAFVWYNLRARNWWDFIEGSKTGSAQAGANAKVLGRYSFSLPPLAEQKRIAEVLGALDDKIELNRRMNATLEATARALFQSWFVDFDPVRAKLDLPAGQAGGRTLSGMDPATAALFPDHLEESPIGKKPIGWDVTTLETALSVLEVGGRPKGGVGGITIGIPSIGAESIVGVGQFDFAKTKYVSVEFYEGMKKGHIQSHDVLLYKDGGRPGEYEPHVSMFGDGFPFERCSINEHVYRLRTNDRLSQEYLYFWLTSEMALAEMRVKGTGVAIPGLNSTAVRSLTTLVPPKPIVEEFTKKAAPLVTRILANSKQSRTLATLRDTLLPKLLRGELSVAEVGKEIPA